MKWRVLSVKNVWKTILHGSIWLRASVSTKIIWRSQGCKLCWRIVASSVSSRPPLVSSEAKLRTVLGSFITAPRYNWLWLVDCGSNRQLLPHAVQDHYAVKGGYIISEHSDKLTLSIYTMLSLLQMWNIRRVENCLDNANLGQLPQLSMWE